MVLFTAWGSLLACHGGMMIVDDTANDTDTDPTVRDTDEEVAVADPAAVLLWEATRGPAEWITVARAAVDSGGCPSATPANVTDWTLTGDCTDDAGRVWTGAGTFRRTSDGERLDFGTLSYTIDAETVALSGQILLTGDVLTANHLARDGSGALRWAHSAHTLTPGSAAINAFNGDGTFAVGGQLTIAGLGSLTVSGQINDTGACTREPDSGDLETTGPVTFDYDLDGSEICDGCVPYTRPEAQAACAF